MNGKKLFITQPIKKKNTKTRKKHLFKQDQLQFAYRRAGQHFKDVMAQNFVVLNENGLNDAAVEGGSGSGGLTGGVGRGGLGVRGRGRGSWSGPRNMTDVQCYKCKGYGHYARSCTGQAGSKSTQGTPGRGARGGRTLTRTLTLTRKRAHSSEQETEKKMPRHEWGDEM